MEGGMRGEAEIDGSAGEGGGQILRTALTLSCVTGRPVRVSRIRAGRPNPGMRAQHVAAASALAAACGARTGGLRLGSAELRFEPGGAGEREAGAGVAARAVRCDVGTAGSTTLILSALAVAASLRGRPVEAVLTGGTDVAWSPTADYTSLALREALSRMGIEFSMEVERRGYYPAGGGVVRASIGACEGGPRPISLPGRLSRRAVLRCSHAGLPAGRVAGALAEAAAELEAAGCAVEPGWEAAAAAAAAEEKEAPRRRGRRGRGRRGGGGGGAAAVAFSADAGSVIGADSLYRDGRFDAAGMAARFAAPGIGADANLADMLVVPAALARGRSRFAVREITGHLGTNLRVAADMTGCRYGVGRAKGGALEVIIDGQG